MNISLYYFYSFIRSLVPIYPVYLLLFESKGLSLAEISLLLAIWSIPVVLLELPTGILSDHWNRKNMLVIGDLLRAGCYLLWFISDGFFLYALGFILWGISESFSSGTIEALLFDSLKKNNLQETFDQVYGKSDYLTNVATAISMLTGGFLAMFLGLRPLLLASVASSILSALVASRFKEVNYFREDQGHNCLKGRRPTYHAFNTFRDAIQFFIGNGFIFLMALLSILGIGISGIIDEYDQLIASGYGLNLGLVGLWGGVRYFMEAAGSALAYRFKSLFIRMGMENPLSIAGTLCILAGICAGLAGFSGSIWLMPFFGLFYLLLSSARILQEDILQQKIEEQGRSTVHSILSLAHNAFGIVVFSFFAATLSGLRAFDILRITSVYLLVLSLLILLAYRFVVSRKGM